MTDNDRAAREIRVSDAEPEAAVGEQRRVTVCAVSGSAKEYRV